MNCIYCHQPIYLLSSYNQNERHCEDCQVNYGCYPNPKVIYSNLDILTGAFYRVEFKRHNRNISLQVNAGMTYYYVGGDQALALNRLFWVFPNNVEEYINKFNKLVAIS